MPFIPIQDQKLIFPAGVTCSTQEQQAAIIKAWAREHSGLPCADFQVVFYHARYYPASRCIFASEDVCKVLPKEQVSESSLTKRSIFHISCSRQRYSSCKRGYGYAGRYKGGSIFFGCPA